MADASTKQTAAEILSAQAEKGKIDGDIVAVRVAGKVVDLHTPIDPALPLEVVRTSEPDGLRVIRHSSAHVLADAVQRLFPGTQVTIGPAIDDGFYYDFDRPDGPFTDEDLRKIEQEMARIVKQNSPFKRITVGRDEALAKFRDQGEHFKVEIIEGVPKDEELSFYVHGEKGKEWTDFCEGPHVPRTGLLKAVKLTSVAGAYWRGDEKNKMLQRIYGTAFASREALDEHVRLVEEAKKRDHRKVGKELELFMFHEYAPAMPFWLPRGTRDHEQASTSPRAFRLRSCKVTTRSPPRRSSTGGFSRRAVTSRTTPRTCTSRRPRMRSARCERGVREEARRGHRKSAPPGYQAFIDCREIERALGLFAKADELPEPLFDLRAHAPQLSRAPDAPRRFRASAPARARRGGPRPRARPFVFSQDDAHIFCTEENQAGEMEAFLKAFYAHLRALRLS